MTKILAITPSFAAWRCAADRLLTLETARAFSQRPGPVQVRPPEAQEVEQMRVRADELFHIAEAESAAMREHSKATASKMTRAPDRSRNGEAPVAPTVASDSHP